MVGGQPHTETRTLWSGDTQARLCRGREHPVVLLCAVQIHRQVWPRRRLAIRRDPDLQAGAEATVHGVDHLADAHIGSDPADLAGHLHLTRDEELRSFYYSLYGEALRAYSDAIKKTLPGWMSGSQRVSRAHFLVGAMIHTLVSYQDMQLMSRGRYEVLGGDQLVDELVTFCAAGLTARGPRRQRRARR